MIFNIVVININNKLYYLKIVKSVMKINNKRFYKYD